MRKRGWGSPNSDEGTYTVELYEYMYCVVQPLYNEMNQATVSHLTGMVQQASRSDLLLQYSMQRLSPHFSTEEA
jgi:hypothetical protein